MTGLRDAITRLKIHQLLETASNRKFFIRYKKSVNVVDTMEFANKKSAPSWVAKKGRRPQNGPRKVVKRKSRVYDYQ